MADDEFIVYLRRSEMPSPSRWRRAILGLELPVELDDGFDPDTFRGFVRCRIRGAKSGFEYSAEDLSPRRAARERAPRGSDFAVTLSADSDLRELACAALAASALAWLTDGLLVDADSGDSYRGADAMHWALEVFREALSAERGPGRLF
jgi:hypothetical protein